MFMLWSQIKIPPNNFSYLQITSEFENCQTPDIFSAFFPCVVTFRTGAGRRLYNYDNIGRWHFRLTTQMKQISMCNDDYINMIFCHHASKGRGCQKRKTESDSDSDGGDNNTRFIVKTAATAVALVRCMLFILSFSSEILFFYLYPWSPEVKWEQYVYSCYNYVHKTRLALANVLWVEWLRSDGHHPISKKIFKSSWRFRHHTVSDQAPYCARTVAVEIGWFKF